MWKLAINKTIEKEYLDKMLPVLVKHIQQWKGKRGKKTLKFRKIRKILLPDCENAKPRNTNILVKLLISTPNDAHKVNEELMKKIINGYNEKDLEKKKLPDIYKFRLKVLEDVFDYDGQISHSKRMSYWLAERIGHNTCTYCNRQYTFTVSGKNDQQRITRPAFDHWFPKSLFPLLSLNIYNLIPCCTVCNSGVKGNTIFQLKNYVHPYMQVNNDPKFKFVPQVSDTDTGTWNVVLSRDAHKNPDVDNTIKAFALDRIYNMHGNLEVKDIMDFAQAYNNVYLKNIFEKMKRDLEATGYKTGEVYRMLFGTELSASQYLDRPLSKLKHDILEYLHIVES